MQPFWPQAWPRCCVAKLPVWLWASWWPTWKEPFGELMPVFKKVSQGRQCFYWCRILKAGSLDFMFGLHWGYSRGHLPATVAVPRSGSLLLVTSSTDRVSYISEQLGAGREHMPSVSLCWSGFLESQDFEFSEWQKSLITRTGSFLHMTSPSWAWKQTNNKQ